MDIKKDSHVLTKENEIVKVRKVIKNGLGTIILYNAYGERGERYIQDVKIANVLQELDNKNKEIERLKEDYRLIHMGYSVGERKAIEMAIKENRELREEISECRNIMFDNHKIIQKIQKENFDKNKKIEKIEEIEKDIEEYKQYVERTNKEKDVEIIVKTNKTIAEAEWYLEKQALIDKLKHDDIKITENLQDGKHNDYQKARLRGMRTKLREILHFIMKDN